MKEAIKLTEEHIRDVLNEDAGDVLDPHVARLEEGEAGLHEEDDGAHDEEEEVVHVPLDHLVVREEGLQPLRVGHEGRVHVHLVFRERDFFEGPSDRRLKR